MRSVLMLLVVVGFVAFATSLPVLKDDSKSEEIEELDIADQPKDVSEEKRHKRSVPSSSSSEESNEVKKPAGAESKPLVAAAAETAAEGAGDATATGVEAVKAAPVALRRKRCVPSQDFNSEESNEDNEAKEEKSDSDEQKQKDPASNSDENEKKDEEDENEIVNENKSEA